VRLKPGERPMTTEAATIAAEALCSGVIPFSPTGELAVGFLADDLRAMCPTIESCEFVVRNAMRHWKAWHGIPELRAILTSRYAPADGIEGYSALYGEDGASIYSGLPAPALALPPTPAEIRQRREAEQNDPATKGALGFLAEAIAAKLEADRVEREELPRLKALQEARRKDRKWQAFPPREPAELDPEL
jgi:hypothetical protein